jgi:hypothetical protein
MSDDKENSAELKIAAKPKISILQHIAEQVQSPIGSQKKAGVILTLPMLWFDDDNLGLDDDLTDPVPSSVFQSTLKGINSRFIKL